MGCFLSTDKNKHTPLPKLRRNSSTSASASTSSRAPPPVDVETVKEVLSETPTLKIQHQNEILSTNNSFKFPPHDDHILEDPINSESENISITTFDDEDNDIYRRKLINRSPAKPRNQNPVSGELPPARKSPRKITEQSPGRVKERSPNRVKEWSPGRVKELHPNRINNWSPGRVKERSPGRVKEQSPGRVRLVGERNGRESGLGSSGRQSAGSGNVLAARSRSPGKCTVMGGGRNEVGRSLSGRRTGKSPSRVRSDLNERIRKAELRSGREREQSRRLFGNGASNKDESLENPLVSLECFIFL